jgi:hypothetical protein
METYAVDFNNGHVVTINPEIEGSKCGRVDDSQAVGLSWLEGQCGVLVESNCRGNC